MKSLGIAAVVVWAAAVGFGVERLWTYSMTPGEAAVAPAGWPGSALISPQSGRATLVMFVHPQCPCSRASLEELRVIMERTHGRADAWVLFMRPQGVAENWERTEHWKMAQSIPGVKIAVDAEGREAERFGAETSGHVVLYDAQGRFVFNGGITGSRGHIGDNDGQRQVMALIDGSANGQATHAVYGCRFHDLESEQS